MEHLYLPVLSKFNGRVETGTYKALLLVANLSVSFKKAAISWLHRQCIRQGSRTRLEFRSGLEYWRGKAKL